MSFLSKLTERVVKNRLTNFISNNNLLNSSQSAYTEYHSTETTLLAVHDHIIRAISQQQITCLCLLDLSAAFDTIDHSILIERLSSWIGISGTALNWIKSYLSSRPFHVKIKNFQSSVFSSFMVFLRGLFLVHFYSLFILLLLVLLSLNVVLIIIFMQMTLSFLFLLLPQNFAKTLLFLKIL